MKTVGDIIRDRREQLELSQADLAAVVGVDKRQIGRWENGDQKPGLDTAVVLARSLGVSLDELAGQLPIGLDLTGNWYAAWQTSRGGRTVIDRHELVTHQYGEYVRMDATGDYRWRGDLHVFEQSMTGTYVAIEADQRSRGALYFTIHPLGDAAAGGWVGLFADGVVGIGWGALARAEHRAEMILKSLLKRSTPEEAVDFRYITAWPEK